MNNRNMKNTNIKENRGFRSKEEILVYDTFKNAIDSLVKEGKERFDIAHNVSVRFNSREIAEIDILVFQNGHPYAIIEVRRSEDSFERVIPRTYSLASDLRIPLCFVCSPKKMVCFNIDKPLDASKIRILNLTEEEVKYFLCKERMSADITWKDFSKKCIGYIKDASFDAEKKNELKNFFVVESKELLNESSSFSFKKDEDEDKFFQILLGTYSKDRLCRYTTLSSIFRTCNDKEQSMCCIVCMNDKSEIDYVAQKLQFPISSDEINKCFILSCCDGDRNNDFTMLRLYADCARGVCIEYTVDKKMVTNNKFIIAPISYARDSQQAHPELDLISKISNINIEGKKFCFKRLSIWQHFFKPYEYRDEQEVRLLYLHSSDNRSVKWIHESHFGIITPIVTFSINENNNEFPLILNKITLGPITREADINKDQLTSLIKSKNIKIDGDIDHLVEKSTISHFRD